MPPTYIPNANRYAENITVTPQILKEESLTTNEPLPDEVCGDLTLIGSGTIALGLIIFAVIQILIIIVLRSN